MREDKLSEPLVFVPIQEPISKREYFAAMILQGYCSNDAVAKSGITPADKAKAALIQADALLNEFYKES